MLTDYRRVLAASPQSTSWPRTLHPLGPVTKTVWPQMFTGVPRTVGQCNMTHSVPQ